MKNFGITINDVTNPRGSIFRSGDYKTSSGGGGLLKSDFKATTEIAYRGAPLHFDEATNMFSLVKTAVVYEDATNTATSYKIKKFSGHLGVGNELKVGDYLAKTVGGTVKQIATLTESASYTTITVAVTLGVALTAGDVLIVQTSGAAEVATCTHLLADDILLDQDQVSVSGISEADEILEAALPYALHSANKTSLPAKITLR